MKRIEGDWQDLLLHQFPLCSHEFYFIYLTVFPLGCQLGKCMVWKTEIELASCCAK
jgi:hypothetical protein